LGKNLTRRTDGNESDSGLSLALIENASGPGRLPANFCAEAFPIKASDNPETIPL